MRRGRLYFLYTWVSVWIFIAVGNIHHTFELLESNKTFAILTVASETEKDTSQMKMETEVRKVKEDCSAQAFWKNNIEISFNENYSEVTLQFKNMKPSEINATFVELQLVPATDNYREFKGFSFYNFENIQIPSNQDTYATSISLEGVKDDIEVFLRATDKLDSTMRSCWSKRLVTIDKNILAINKVQPAYKADIFLPYDVKYFNMSNTTEDEYIEMFMNYKNLKALHSNLPEVHEAAVALLQKDIIKVGDEYKWDEGYLFNRRVIQDEVVIGMFGNVKETDLQHLSDLITTLHIIAPDLKISYSDNLNNVTLPIHFVGCTYEFSMQYNDCYQNTLGEFYHPNPFEKKDHGFIWVDGHLQGNERLFVLTHELGHSLGLGHNLCTDYSVMSYSDLSPRNTYFDYLDLMMLRVLYDPSSKSPWLSESKLIKDHNLDENKLDNYKFYDSGDSGACHFSPPGYDFLIDLQTKGYDYVKDDIISKDK